MKDVGTCNSGAEWCAGGVRGIGVFVGKMMKETETGVKMRVFPVCMWCMNWKQKDARVSGHFVK